MKKEIIIIVLLSLISSLAMAEKQFYVGIGSTMNAHDKAVITNGVNRYFGYQIPIERYVLQTRWKGFQKAWVTYFWPKDINKDGTLTIAKWETEIIANLEEPEKCKYGLVDGPDFVMTQAGWTNQIVEP